MLWQRMKHCISKKLHWELTVQKKIGINDPKIPRHRNPTKLAATIVLQGKSIKKECDRSSKSSFSRRSPAALSCVQSASSLGRVSLQSLISVISWRRHKKLWKKFKWQCPWEQSADNATTWNTSKSASAKGSIVLELVHLLYKRSRLKQDGPICEAAIAVICQSLAVCLVPIQCVPARPICHALQDSFDLPGSGVWRKSAQSRLSYGNQNIHSVSAIWQNCAIFTGMQSN